MSSTEFAWLHPLFQCATYEAPNRFLALYFSVVSISALGKGGGALEVEAGKGGGGGPVLFAFGKGGGTAGLFLLGTHLKPAGN